jgi:hypothetical protein
MHPIVIIAAVVTFGYRFSPAGLTLAKKTIANFIEMPTSSRKHLGFMSKSAARFQPRWRLSADQPDPSRE